MIISNPIPIIALNTFFSMTLLGHVFALIALCFGYNPTWLLEDLEEVRDAAKQEEAGDIEKQ